MTGRGFHNPTVNDYFDKVFYINLDRNTGRRASMEAQFERWGITNAERVRAVEPAELQPDRMDRRNFIKDNEKYNLGTLACRASHVKCVRLAKERGYRRVLILEDDARFDMDPNFLLKMNYAGLDPWDMLYFGGLVEPQYRGQIVCAHAYAITSKLYGDIIGMAESSGMEIDNFYAKILQHMSYNHNASGKYDIRIMNPFNTVVQHQEFPSDIQTR